MGKGGTTRLDSLNGWDGSRTEVPQTARPQILYFFEEDAVRGKAVRLANKAAKANFGSHTRVPRTARLNYLSATELLTLRQLQQ